MVLEIMWMRSTITTALLLKCQEDTKRTWELLNNLLCLWMKWLIGKPGVLYLLWSNDIIPCSDMFDFIDICLHTKLNAYFNSELTKLYLNTPETCWFFSINFIIIEIDLSKRCLYQNIRFTFLWNSNLRSRHHDV